MGGPTNKRTRDPQGEFPGRQAAKPIWEEGANIPTEPGVSSRDTDSPDKGGICLG